MTALQAGTQAFERALLRGEDLQAAEQAALRAFETMMTRRRAQMGS